MYVHTAVHNCGSLYTSQKSFDYIQSYPPDRCFLLTGKGPVTDADQKIDEWCNFKTLYLNTN